MKILHVTHGLSRGGLENGVVSLANGLPAGEFDQAICCLDLLGELASRVPARVPIFLMNRRRHDLTLPWRLRRTIEDWKPDIVHCRNWNAWPDTLAAHRFAPSGGRLVWSFHGFADGDAFPLRRRLASRLLSVGTDRLVAVCRHSAEIFSERTGIAAHRFEVLYNGVDTRRFAPAQDRAARKAALGIDPGRLVVLTVANLTAIKDHRSLVRVVASLASAEAVLPRFLFVGEGPLRADLKALIDSLGLRDTIDLVGSSGQVADYLAAADAFVLPSRLEGMSNAILEAMASGLPVIANAVGGNPELVAHGQTGLLCEAGDPGAMVAALRRLMSDADLRQRMGHAARRRAQDMFSIDSMITGYADFYRRTAAGT